MISLTQFRIHLFEIVSLLTKTGSTLEVTHKGKAYELFLRPSGAKPRNAYHMKVDRHKRRLNPHTLSYGGCKVCGELVVEGICLNKTCPNNIVT